MSHRSAANESHVTSPCAMSSPSPVSSSTGSSLVARARSWWNIAPRVDSASNNDLPNPATIYETFPLDDGSDGIQIESGCGYPYCDGTPCMFTGNDTPYVPHVSEGIDAVA